MDNILINSIGIVMLIIEPGEFQMGSVTPPANWDETPVHRVKITQPFYISQTEVTIEQFRQFRADFSGSQEYSPYAAGVSWYDAVAFCEWLSKKEDKLYRLPTETEWEYACRTNDKLQNMLSGVREWCLDWYGEYLSDDQVDPAGPEHGIARVIRGGVLDQESSTAKNENYARPTNRGGIAPGFGSKDHAAAPPQRRAPGAHPGPAGALLAPGFRPAAPYFGPGLGGRAAGPAAGPLPGHHFVEEVPLYRYPEDVLFEVHLPYFFLLNVINVYRRHGSPGLLDQ